MKHDDYCEHVVNFTSEMSAVTKKKNPDYSMNDDAMNNFKAISVMLGGGTITPQIVWAVLAGKHITAIMSHMAQGRTLQDETIHGRFIDLANYAMLGDALSRDLASSSQPENQRDPLSVVLELWEGLKYLDGRVEFIIARSENPPPALVRELTSIRNYISSTTQNLEKIYHGQHGSPEHLVPVSRDPADVQNPIPPDRAEREPDAGPGTRPYPPLVSQGETHARNDELRGNRERTRLVPHRDEIIGTKPEDRAVHIGGIRPVQEM